MLLMKTLLKMIWNCRSLHRRPASHPTTTLLWSSCSHGTGTSQSAGWLPLRSYPKIMYHDVVPFHLIAKVQAYLLLELLSNPVIISVATYMKICQMVFKKHPLPLMWWNEFGNRNTLLSVLHFILKDTDYASEGLGNNDQTTKESALNSFRLWNTIMCVIMCCIHIYINIALVSPSVTMSVKPYLHMKDYGRTCYIVTITCFFWYERKF